jgi:hypothetical protein
MSGEDKYTQVQRRGHVDVKGGGLELSWNRIWIETIDKALSRPC